MRAGTSDAARIQAAVLRPDAVREAQAGAALAESIATVPSAAARPDGRGGRVRFPRAQPVRPATASARTHASATPSRRIVEVVMSTR